MRAAALLRARRAYLRAERKHQAGMLSAHDLQWAEVLLFLAEQTAKKKRRDK